MTTILTASPSPVSPWLKATGIAGALSGYPINDPSGLSGGLNSANGVGINNTFYGTVVTTGSFVAGVQYAIVNVGDTNFTLIGATSNSVGVIFTCTGVGGGTTGTATTITPGRGRWSTSNNYLQFLTTAGVADATQFDITAPDQSFIFAFGFRIASATSGYVSVCGKANDATASVSGMGLRANNTSGITIVYHNGTSLATAALGALSIDTDYQMVWACNLFSATKTYALYAVPLGGGGAISLTGNLSGTITQNTATTFQVGGTGQNAGLAGWTGNVDLWFPQLYMANKALPTNLATANSGLIYQIASHQYRTLTAAQLT